MAEYGPGILKLMQKLFDQLCAELKLDLEGVLKDERAREEIARRIIESSDGDTLDVEAVRDQVLTAYRERLH